MGRQFGVRLPTELVDALGLIEGDEVVINFARKREPPIVSEETRKKAIEAIRRVAVAFPPDFKFDREEANER